VSPLNATNANVDYLFLSNPRNSIEKNHHNVDIILRGLIHEKDQALFFKSIAYKN